MSKQFVLITFVMLATLVTSCVTVTAFPGRGFLGKLSRKRRQPESKEDMEVSEFSQEEKNALVNLHNMYRSAVNPPATAMKEVSWDDDIGNLAQDWADQCRFVHRTSRAYKEFKNIGETIYFLKGDNYDVKSPVEDWYKQSEDYSLQDNSCETHNENGENCDHYMTVMTASVDKIGCGIKYCKAGENQKENGYIFVCNYNAEYDLSKKPYEAGPSCSKCPTEAPKCRYNMCVTEEMLKECKGYNGSVKWTGVQRQSTKSEAMECPEFAPGNVAPELSKTDSSGPAEVTKDKEKPAPQSSTTAGPPNVGPQNDRDLDSHMLNMTLGRGTSDGVSVTALPAFVTFASILATTLFFSAFAAIVVGV